MITVKVQIAVTFLGGEKEFDIGTGHMKGLLRSLAEFNFFDLDGDVKSSILCSFVCLHSAFYFPHVPWEKSCLIFNLNCFSIYI